MKKSIAIVFFVFVLCILGAQTILQDYVFEYSVSSYTEITSGTVLGSESSDDQFFIDPASPLGGSAVRGPGFPIGFDFAFGDAIYNRIGIQTNGWISLGNSSLGEYAVDMRTTNITTPLSTTLTGQNAIQVARIAGLAKDLKAQPGSEIRIAQAGSAPNRTFTIQWKNYCLAADADESMNFQILLKEANMQVRLVYGEINSTGTVAVQVGLRTAPASPATNYANRFIPLGTSWAASSLGSSAGSAAVISPSQYPVTGATFSWTPPVSLDADFSASITSGTAPLSVQFNDLSLSSGSQISSWNWSFGSQTSSLQNPLITFGNAGSYDVSLTVSDGTNSDTETKIGYITVLDGNIPGVNTSIQMDSNDAIVSWNPMQTDDEQTPDYYFLYFNGSDDPYAEFYFLAPVSGSITQYRHVGVALGAQHMFYRVTAVRFGD